MASQEMVQNLILNNGPHQDNNNDFGKEEAKDEIIFSEDNNNNNKKRTYTSVTGLGVDPTVRLTKLLPGGNKWYTKNPREVVVIADLLLLDVDIKKQNFESEICLQIYWKQPEIKPYIPEDIEWDIFDDGRSIPLDLDDLFEGDLSLEWIEKEYSFNEETDTICLLLRVRAVFGERMELQRFPIDRQFLNILLKARIANRYGKNEGNWIWKSNIQKISWLPKDVKFDNTNIENPNIAQITARLGPALSEYSMESAWADFRVLNKPNEKDPQPPFKIRFRVERKPGYYVGQIIIPMLLITMCCFASLSMSNDDIGDRLSVSLTMMLSVIAYRYVLNSILPPIQYLTWMDYYVLSNFFIVTLFVAQNSMAGIPKLEDYDIDYWFAPIMITIIIMVNGFMLFVMFSKSFRIGWNRMDVIDRTNESDDPIDTDNGDILSIDNLVQKKRKSLLANINIGKK